MNRIDHLQEAKNRVQQVENGNLGPKYSQTALSMAAIAVVEELRRFNQNFEKALEVFVKPQIIIADPEGKNES